MVKPKSILAVDYRKRIIWLDGDITDQTARRFRTIIRKINTIKIDPIVMYIRGDGGDPWSALSIMMDISNSPSQIGIVAHERVASGSFLITQAGFWRAALPGTKFLFHSAEGICSGHNDDRQFTRQKLVDWIEMLELIDYLQFQWFSRRGRPLEIIYDFLKTDKTLTLSEAKKFILVDYHYSRKDFLKDRLSIGKSTRR